MQVNNLLIYHNTAGSEQINGPNPPPYRPRLFTWALERLRNLEFRDALFLPPPTILSTTTPSVPNNLNVLFYDLITALTDNFNNRLTEQRGILGTNLADQFQQAFNQIPRPQRINQLPRFTLQNLRLLRLLNRITEEDYEIFRAPLREAERGIQIQFFQNFGLNAPAILHLVNNGRGPLNILDNMDPLGSPADLRHSYYLAAQLIQEYEELLNQASPVQRNRFHTGLETINNWYRQGTHTTNSSPSSNSHLTLEAHVINYFEAQVPDTTNPVYINAYRNLMIARGFFRPPPANICPPTDNWRIEAQFMRVMGSSIPAELLTTLFNITVDIPELRGRHAIYARDFDHTLGFLLDNLQNVYAFFRLDCGTFPSILNGAYVLDNQNNNTTFGSTANVICFNGYNASAISIMCNSSGIWETAECIINGNYQSVL